MDKSKKKRVSILKKQSDFEESSPTETIAFKNKRKISFYEKKSIKEFCAGENAETIWGTSYEESANSPSSKQDPLTFCTIYKNDFRNDVDVLQNHHPLHDKQYWVNKQNTFMTQQNIAHNEMENYVDIVSKFEIDSIQTKIEDLSLKETKKRLNCTIDRSEQNILKICQDLNEESSITLDDSECNIVKTLRKKIKSPKKVLKDFAEIDENSNLNYTDINMSIDRMNTTEGFLKIEMMIENSQKQRSITLIDNAIDKQEEERKGLNKLRTDTIISEEILDISSRHFELKSKEVETCFENLDMSIDNLQQNFQQNRKTILLDEKLDILLEKKSSLSSNNFVHVSHSENNKNINKCVGDSDKDAENIYYTGKSQDNILYITDESFLKAQEKLKEISFKESILRNEIMKTFQESVVKNNYNTKIKHETKDDEMDIVKEENELKQSLQEDFYVKTNDTVEIINTNLVNDFQESFDIVRCALNNTESQNIEINMDIENKKLLVVEDKSSEKRQTINFQGEQNQNDMEISLIYDLSEPLMPDENINNQNKNLNFGQKAKINLVEDQTIETGQNSVESYSINNSLRLSADENLFSKGIEPNEQSCQQISGYEMPLGFVSTTITPKEELNCDRDKSLKNLARNKVFEAESLKRNNTVYINHNLETKEHNNMQVLNTQKSIIFEFGNNDIMEDVTTIKIKSETYDESNSIKNNLGTRKTIIFENDNMVENKSKIFKVKSINRQTILSPTKLPGFELTGINALNDSTSADLKSQVQILSKNESDPIDKMDFEVYNQKFDYEDIKHDKSIDDKIMELSKSILNYQAPALDLDLSDEESSIVEKNCNLSYLSNLPTPVINLNEVPKINIINTSVELTPKKSPKCTWKSPKKDIISSSNIFKQNSPRKELFLRNSLRKICETNSKIIEKINLNDLSNSFSRTLNFDEAPKKENNTGFSGSKSFFNISDSCNDDIEKTKIILVDSSESSMDVSKMKDESENHISKVSRYRRSSLNKKLCSKCKRCRLSMDKTEIDNFKLEPEFIEDVDFSVLDKYKNYTTLQDVWRAHERRQVNIYALDLDNVNCEKNRINPDINLGKYFKNFQIENCFPIGNKFENELKNKISSINNTWKIKVCSYYSSNFIILTYTPCPTIELVIECRPVNFQNFNSKFNKIYTRQSCIYAEESWSPIDKLIVIEFKKLIPSNEKLYHKCSKLKELNLFLKFCDEIIQDIIINVKKLMSVIINSRASLEHYGDKVVVHKIYYDKLSNKKTIVIEINRIKDISVRNIISPHISQFTTASIRGFPIGITFIELILNNLSSFLSKI